MEIKEIQQKLNDELSKRKYGSRPDELYEPIRYFLNLGGKRLRPLLCLLSYSLFKDDIEEAIEPAIGIELFHNFTLLHDDIMDEAPLRRGKATIHEKWNSHIAILSGDAMFVKSCQSVSSVDPSILKTVLNGFNRTALEVCEGQQMDMNFETSDSVNVEDYLEMIRLKTAVLLGFSLELGAIIAGQDESISKKLYQIGMNAGIGFQIKDDYLDVFGEKDKFGKQLGGDIIANKKTYLLLKANELSKGKEKEELEKWINASNFDESEKVQAIISLYKSLKIDELSLGIANEYFQKARASLVEMNISENSKTRLISFLETLINRDH